MQVELSNNDTMFSVFLAAAVGVGRTVADGRTAMEAILYGALSAVAGYIAVWLWKKFANWAAPKIEKYVQFRKKKSK